MNAHVPTLFLMLIAINVTLTFSVGYVVLCVTLRNTRSFYHYIFNNF